MSKNSIYTKEGTIIGLIVSVIVLIIVLITNSTDDENHQKFCDKFKTSEIRGKIYDKKIEENNHNKIIIYYLNNDNKRMSFVAYNIYFYEYVTKGDTIIKNLNSDTVTIINNTKKKVFIFDFGCQ